MHNIWSNIRLADAEKLVLIFLVADGLREWLQAAVENAQFFEQQTFVGSTSAKARDSCQMSKEVQLDGWCHGMLFTESFFEHNDDQIGVLVKFLDSLRLEGVNKLSY